MAEWQDWIGRTETHEDIVDPGVLARFAATLDGAAEEAVPQGFHWCLAPPSVATAGLGQDGHPRRSDSSLLPPVPLPRRMWAASAVEFVAPLRIGERIRRISRTTAVAEKRGASGPLVFVEVEHQIFSADRLAVRETQSIVYRDAAPADAPPAPPPLGPGRFTPDGGDAHRWVHPDPVHLFRYSALTFNSHRIHYDLPYATGEEGYRGLVVHGPLTATLLLDLARRTLGDQPLARFAFRALSPAIAGEPLHLTLRVEAGACTFGAFADDGRAVMSATGSDNRAR